MKQKGKLFTSVSIGTAAVWFSTHCGAGFASGTQELQYFASHGWYGVFMPILTFAILAISYYICLETARQTDTWNYDGWAKHAFALKPERVLKGERDPLGTFLSVALDIGVVVVTVAATAAAIAAGAQLVSQYLHVPELLGSLIMFLIITLLCIFGEKVVRKSAMVITISIIVIISIILIVGLVEFWPTITDYISNGYTNNEAPAWSVTGSATATTEGSFGNTLLWALTYAGFQMCAVSGIAAAFKGAKDRKESAGAVGIGYIINCIMLVGICLLLLGGMPEVYTDPDAKLLPTVHMVNQVDVPFLNVVYPILLFLALISTGVSLIFGMVARIEPYALKNKENKLLGKVIITILCLLVCYLISRLGLMWVIQVAYKYLGLYSWIFVILPLWIIGTRNIKKRRKIKEATNA